ncbi:hypothetical protein [Mycoplasmopsis felifaucium]|uniref:hypothetical protein n=1 Tax=Mycoplasmopsis felifaucium TaxID=35768 RepID=UPI00048980D8|nr:hypothetical protein [Mycoplasmopsis felifaucium]
MNYYNVTPQFLSKGVVLCVPGLFCTAETYDPMWKNLKLLENITTISICDEVLQVLNIHSGYIINVLNRQREIPKISFFKVLFSNWIGRVDDQVEELHTIILKIQQVLGADTPIFLVGYSKGGLVNMRYVSLHKGIVKNITSIGTPYENNFLQTILTISDDIFKNAAIMSYGGVSSLMSKISDLLDNYVADEDLGSNEFFVKLKNGWNSLPSYQKPYITCIGCSQIGLSSNSLYGSDLIVDVQVQRASNYSNINSRKLIDDNYEHFDHNKWYDILYQLSPVSLIEITENIRWGIEKFIKKWDIIDLLFGFLLALIPYTWNLDKYDLIHTKQLGNKNVCKEVLAAINKSNPNQGGYYE